MAIPVMLTALCSRSRLTDGPRCALQALIGQDPPTGADPGQDDRAVLEPHLAASAVSIALALTLGAMLAPGNGALMLLIAVVVACAACSLVARKSGHASVEAIVALSALLGWPMIAAYLALALPSGIAESATLVTAVAMFVAFSMSSVLRRPVAMIWLTALAISVGAGTWLADKGSLGAPLFGFLSTAAAGVMSMLGRDRADGLFRTRHRARRLMQDLTVGDSLEATAQAIARQIAEAGDFAVVLLSAFMPDGSVRHLANASTLPEELPIEAGEAVPNRRAAYLLERAPEGPWIADWGPNADPTSFDARMYQAGLRTTLHTPVIHRGSIIGVLGVGYGDVKGGGSSQRHELLRQWRSAVVETSSLIGGLLAPQIARLDGREGETARLKAIIEGARFYPVFQPIVEMSSGSIAGFEALTRFTDGDRPDILFEAGARLGLGEELETATVVAAIDAAPAVLPVNAYLSINVSPEFLLSGVPARLLARARRPMVLELTEHVEVCDYGAVRAAARSIGGRIRLAVDDAGAGFASLRHVLELRPDIVKLDVALVRSIDSDPARQALIAGMRHFAERGEFVLVAEGVETPQERATLVGLGVIYGQGYLFGRPVSGSDISMVA